MRRRLFPHRRRLSALGLALLFAAPAAAVASSGVTPGGLGALVIALAIPLGVVTLLLGLYLSSFDGVEGYTGPLRRRRRGCDGSSAPDLDPADVPQGRRVGFDGREIKPARGGLTGLEGGRSGMGEPPGYGSAGSGTPDR